MPAPSKAKGASLARPQTPVRPAHYIQPTPHRNQVPACDNCGDPCSPTLISIDWSDPEGTEEAVYCSPECLCAHSGEQLLADYPAQAVRAEMKAIVKLTCPACKARIREHK